MDDKVKKINEDVDRLLEQFALKLDSFNEETNEFFLVRKNFLRKIKDDKNNNGFSKNIMFKNAPFSSGDFIIAEKKKW